MNIVLIGMPGSGKSTVGRLLSQRLGMPLVDTDALVEAAANRSIPELFAAEGEAAFRDRETAAVRVASALENTVIATGGGVVLRSENMQALSGTGLIFFRDRAVEDIMGEDHSGRPLVGGDRERILQLYTQRIDLYRKYARYTISGTKTAEEAADRIATIYLEECAI